MGKRARNNPGGTNEQYPQRLKGTKRGIKTILQVAEENQEDFALFSLLLL